MTVGILDGEALPVIEIRSKNLFFDFTAKYQKGMSDTLIPAPIAPEVTSKVQQLALQVYRTLGCRDMGRVDFMFNVYGQPFVLEINTIPGFTSMSLLPLAAQYAGYKFPDLCLKLAYLAYQRKQASQHQPLSCGKV